MVPGRLRERICVLVVLAFLVLAGCAPVPSPKTLAGEWHQDSTYFQSKELINQFAEIDAFEDDELFFTNDRVAASRIVGTKPDSKRVYWDSPFSLAVDSSKKHRLSFTSHSGEPVTTTVYFEGKRLILEIGERRMGFLREKATNLRIKGYVPRNARDQAAGGPKVNGQ